jgi:signal transduction histidine kinase
VRRRKDGGDVAVSLTVSPIRDAAGALIGVSKVARDISARKQIDDQRAALLAREQTMRVEMERASKLKDDFLAVLSHELRTPLSAVIGYANLLASGALPKERTGHALDAIRRNAKAQAQLVDSLLDLSRVLAGKFELTVEPLDVWRVVEAAIDVVRPQAMPRGGHRRHSAAASASGDWRRVAAAAGVLEPAVECRQVHARRRLVSIHSLDQDGHVSIVITDTGSGISDDFLPHVFDRFSQGEIPETVLAAGLGLGLALVREIVHAHSGAVSAASAGDGLGSTFTVMLPAAAGAPASAPGVSTSAYPKESHSLREIDVLVVDDEADVRHLLTLLLEAHGANVRSASSSSEALGAIRERRPHVLLADLRMPNEDGYSLIRTIRAGERDQDGLPRLL